MNVITLFMQLCLLGCALAAPFSLTEPDPLMPKYGNPEENPYLNLIEGDIVPVEGQTDRNAIRTKKWPKGIIPYVIDKSVFTSTEVSKIKAAIADYDKYTCIKWTPRTTQSSYVKITRVGSGCYAYLGQVSTSRSQIINLSRGCFSHGTIVHEMMHTVGFWHEHVRYDRGPYVKILPENIMSGKSSQFSMKSSSVSQLLGSPYKYSSVMHYSAYAFSKNGQKTIQALKSGGSEMGQRKGFDTWDIKRINKLYNC